MLKKSEHEFLSFSVSSLQEFFNSSIVQFFMLIYGRSSMQLDRTRISSFTFHISLRLRSSPFFSTSASSNSRLETLIVQWTRCNDDIFSNNFFLSSMVEWDWRLKRERSTNDYYNQNLWWFLPTINSWRRRNFPSSVGREKSENGRLWRISKKFYSSPSQ